MYIGIDSVGSKGRGEEVVREWDVATERRVGDRAQNSMGREERGDAVVVGGGGGDEMHGSVSRGEMGEEVVWGAGGRGQGSVGREERGKEVVREWLREMKVSREVERVLHFKGLLSFGALATVLEGWCVCISRAPPSVPFPSSLSPSFVSLLPLSLPLPLSRSCSHSRSISFSVSRTLSLFACTCSFSLLRACASPPLP